MAPKEPTPEPEWTPALQSDLESLLTVGEECISENELKGLLQYCSTAEKRFNLYDGFEPSGRMHIAQGVFKVIHPINTISELNAQGILINISFVVYIGNECKQMYIRKRTFYILGCRLVCLDERQNGWRSRQNQNCWRVLN